MGIDLTLLASSWDSSAIFPTVQLPLDRRHALWERMDKVETQRLNAELYWHDDEEGLVKRTEDNYGSPLRFITAKEMAEVLREFNNDDPHATYLNLAAQQYLSAMPALTRIVLWWH